MLEMHKITYKKDTLNNFWYPSMKGDNSIFATLIFPSFHIENEREFFNKKLKRRNNITLIPDMNILKITFLNKLFPDIIEYSLEHVKEDSY